MTGHRHRCARREVSSDIKLYIKCNGHAPTACSTPIHKGHPGKLSTESRRRRRRSSCCWPVWWALVRSRGRHTSLRPRGDAHEKTRPRRRVKETTERTLTGGTALVVARRGPIRRPCGWKQAPHRAERTMAAQRMTDRRSPQFLNTADWRRRAFERLPAPPRHSRNQQEGRSAFCSPRTQR